MDFHLSIPAILFMILCYCSVKIFYSVWWKPKSLERYFRRIGINGSSYKLMYGDMKEIRKLMSEARAKPMLLCHAIVPRVLPDKDRMVRKYGKISVSWHGRKAQVLVADAGLMKHILNDKNGSFRKPPRTNPLIRLLTLGISTLEGNQWERRRKMINPAFHHDKILGMTPAFLTSCCNLVQRWAQQIEGCNEKFELDIAPEMKNLASDIIARAAFGTTFEEARVIFELQKELGQLILETSFGLYLPGLRFLPTKKNRRRHEIGRAIKEKLSDMIVKKERKIRDGDDNVDDDDLLSLLLKCQKQTDNDMTIDDVMEECKLFYFAGQETTANWLTWTMIVLSMHTNWQDRAREEVVHVFGRKLPDIKSLNQLKIVSMILQEVIRLYPSVTVLFRHTLESTRIGDMIIPPGVDIVLPTLMVHHDPENWGEDADEFRPERFAEGVSKATKDHETAAFYPFGWGPRFCLGQNFAAMEAKLAMAMILQHFSFELSPSYIHAPHTVLTLQPQFGAPLLLHKI